MKLTIERADGTKVHIEGDEASVLRIARELSPPPVQTQPLPVIPWYPGVDTWRLGRPWWGVQPEITWTSGSISASDLRVTATNTADATYSVGEPS